MQGSYCLGNDIFSLGITLLELASGLELPANGKLWQELRSLVLPEAALIALSTELQTVIRSMMEPDPARRPTVDQLLKTPRLKVLKKQRTVSKVFAKSVSHAEFCSRTNAQVNFSHSRRNRSSEFSRSSSCTSPSGSFAFATSGSLTRIAPEFSCQRLQAKSQSKSPTMTRTAMTASPA
jgi:serine/threonine protein kinase